MNDDRPARRRGVYVVAAGVALAVLFGAVVFQPSRALSPAERKVEAWLRGVSLDGNMNPAGIHDLGPEAISILIAALTNQNSRAQTWYWKVNRKMPVSVRRFLPRARNAETERLAVTIALMESRFTRIAISDLIRLTTHPSHEIRVRAAEILSEVTTKEDAAWLPNLNETLNRETNTYVRVRLATAIGLVDPNAREISIVLQPALNGPDSSLRKLAKEGLGRIAQQERQPINPKRNGKDK